MSTTDTPTGTSHNQARTLPDGRHLSDPVPARAAVGPVGRLGRFTAPHFRGVGVGGLLVAAVLGVFEPRVENALSGAGWDA
ncbi:MAG: hypothetical protein ACLPV4_13610, partial [Solirubrobacteraceae bacterium]